MFCGDADGGRSAVNIWLSFQQVLQNCSWPLDYILARLQHQRGKHVAVHELTNRAAIHLPLRAGELRAAAWVDHGSTWCACSLVIWTRLPCIVRFRVCMINCTSSPVAQTGQRRHIWSIGTSPTRVDSVCPVGTISNIFPYHVWSGPH